MLGSLIFYAWGEPKYIWLMLCSILINYGIGLLMEKYEKQKKLLLILDVIINIGILGYFKYFCFLLQIVYSCMRTTVELTEIRLPIGISFFTFQILSYIVDLYRGHYRAQKNFVHLALYISFFPQLIAGPIVLYKEMIPQFEALEKRAFSPANFAKGISLFVLGLAKKVLLADVLALATNFGFAQTYFLDAPSTFLVILAYTFQIYFDFSGYSDMAMGLGYMFNIALPVNFRSPYKACSVKELWQRWHMTLSRFFVTYVYIPLGGSKKGKAKMICNTMVIFALSGLWHGANWTYVAWGTMQGLLVVWDNLGIVGVKGCEEKEPARFHIPRWLGWLFTFSFFNLSLFFFRSESMTHAFQMFKNLFSFKNTGYIYKLAATMDIPEFYIFKQAISMFAPNLLNTAYIAVFLLMLAISGFALTRKNTLEIVETSNYRSGFCWYIVFLFLWSFISFSQVSAFIYFNF